VSHGKSSAESIRCLPLASRVASGDRAEARGLANASRPYRPRVINVRTGSEILAGPAETIVQAHSPLRSELHGEKAGALNVYNVDERLTRRQLRPSRSIILTTDRFRI